MLYPFALSSTALSRSRLHTLNDDPIPRERPKTDDDDDYVIIAVAAAVDGFCTTYSVLAFPAVNLPNSSSAGDITVQNILTIYTYNIACTVCTRASITNSACLANTFY